MNQISALNLLQRLDLRNSWKIIGKQYENDKLKIITQTWNDEFELPDSSYSVLDILDCIRYM